MTTFHSGILRALVRHEGLTGSSIGNFEATWICFGLKIIFQDRVTIGWVGCGCDSSARKLLEEEMCKLQSGDSILVGFKGI